MGAGAPELEKFLGYKPKNPDQPEGVVDDADKAENLANQEQGPLKTEGQNTDNVDRTIEAPMPPFDSAAVLAGIMDKAVKKGLEGTEAQLWITEKFFEAKRDHTLSHREAQPKFKYITERYKKGAERWEKIKEHPYGKYVGYLASESMITVPAAALGAHLGILDSTTAIHKAGVRIGMNSGLKSVIDLLLDKKKRGDVYKKLKNIFAKKESAVPGAPVEEKVKEEIDLAEDLPSTMSSTGVPVFSSDSVSGTEAPVFEQDVNTSEPKRTKINPKLVRYGAMGLSAGSVFILSGGLAGAVSLGVTVAKETAPMLVKYIEKKVDSKKSKWIENNNIDITLSPEELALVLENMEYRYRNFEKKIARLKWVRTFTKGALDLVGCVAKWSAVVDVSTHVAEAGQVATGSTSNMVHGVADSAEKVVKTAGKQQAKNMEKHNEKVEKNS